MLTKKDEELIAAATKAISTYQTSGGHVVRATSGTAIAAVAGGPLGTITAASVSLSAGEG